MYFHGYSLVWSVFFVFKICSPTDNGVQEDEYKPYIVTTSEQISNYYFQLRPQNPQLPSKLKPKLKERICHRIEDVFKGYGVYDTALFQGPLMSDRSKHIFKQIFVRKKNVCFCCPEYKYKNRSKLRTFSIAGVEHTERTFMCLKYELDAQKEFIFFPYYVSDYSYNVNEVPGGPSIEGRFIFVGNKVLGLAEKYATYQTDVEGLSLEEYYLKNLPDHPPAREPENDPVCRQDPWRKLRFCTHVCSYKYREEGCREGVSVEECTEKKFILEDEARYNEWFLKCQFGYGDMYVSRGFRDNEFLVWGPNDDGELELFQLVSNVGFAFAQ